MLFVAEIILNDLKYLFTSLDKVSKAENISEIFKIFTLDWLKKICHIIYINDECFNIFNDNKDFIKNR